MTIGKWTAFFPKRMKLTNMWNQIWGVWEYSALKFRNSIEKCAPRCCWQWGGIQEDTWHFHPFKYDWVHILSNRWCIKRRVNNLRADEMQNFDCEKWKLWTIAKFHEFWFNFLFSFCGQIFAQKHMMGSHLIFVIFLHKCTFGLNFSPQEISRQNSVNKGRVRKIKMEI